MLASAGRAHARRPARRSRSSTNFAFQWLDVRGVDDIEPDPVLFPEFDAGSARRVRDASSSCSSTSVLLEDRSVLELLDGGPHLRERAARAALRHRRTCAATGSAASTLADANRWGLLGKGGVLMATSYAEPHGAGAARRLDPREHHGHAAGGAAAGRRGVPREQGRREGADGARASWSSTARNPSCNACHGVMDPLGFALENFDAIGAWRVEGSRGRRRRSTRRASSPTARR